MRILINQLKNIGDVLLSTAAIALVRKAYPDAWITLMVAANVAPFFENHPLVNEILPFSYKSKDGSISSMIKMVKEVKNRNFDVNISLESRLRPLLIATLAGIPIRIAGDGMDRYGGKKEWYRFLYTQLFPITTQEKEHQSETFMKVVRPFLHLPDTIEAKPTMPIPSEESKEKMKKLLRIDDGERKKVLFCVRGTWYGKNWDPDYFAEVINSSAKKYDADCYVIGTAGDYAYAQSIIDKCKVKVENICGKTRPSDLVPLFMYSDLLVSIDTGSAHIAATTDIPILSIYFATNPVQWRPLSDKALVLCEKCLFDQFDLKDTGEFVVYEKILPEHVIKALDIQINRNR